MFISNGLNAHVLFYLGVKTKQHSGLWILTKDSLSRRAFDLSSFNCSSNAAICNKNIYKKISNMISGRHFVVYLPWAMSINYYYLLFIYITIITQLLVCQLTCFVNTAYYVPVFSS